MTAATIRLIEAVERLQSGSLLQHNVDAMHELAGLARLEQVEYERGVRALDAAVGRMEQAARPARRRGPGWLIP